VGILACAFAVGICVNITGVPRREPGANQILISGKEMTSNIVPFESTAQASPFDSIRQIDGTGVEFWSARDLMELLTYVKWQNVESTMTRTVASLKASGHNVFDHVTDSSKMVEIGSKSSRKVVDYRLSRFGCYLFSMNGDPTKPEVAAAQSYFAVKAREAETVIPAQNDRIRELELSNENYRLKASDADRQDNRIALHGLPIALLLEGKSDAIVEVEKPTTEVIDDRFNVRFEGQTLKQMAEYIQSRHGIRFKSGADLKRALIQFGGQDLIAQTPRTVTAEYVPKEFLDEAYRLLTNGDRQKLIGE